MLKKLATAAVLALLTVATMAPPAAAASKELYEIPEMTKESRRWGGFAWLPGIVLGVGILIVNFKDAKRSHMD